MINIKDLNKTPICHLHNMIQDKCSELVNPDNLNQDKVLEIADDILKLSFIAEEKGQHMEDRLRVYREGIEDMGFLRWRE
jgi:glucose-6-phosphate dehydrogenase assembly protein OpcA